jgi:hypothetical protein
VFAPRRDQAKRLGQITGHIPGKGFPSFSNQQQFGPPETILSAGFPKCLPCGFNLAHDSLLFGQVIEICGEPDEQAAIKERAGLAILAGLAGRRAALLDSTFGTPLGWQILLKEVTYSAETLLENTVRLWQEIYDDDGALVEVHQKYPADTGHQKL